MKTRKTNKFKVSVVPGAKINIEISALPLSRKKGDKTIYSGPKCKDSWTWKIK